VKWFRSAFSDLHQGAGYTPRSTAKKKLEGVGVTRVAEGQQSTTAGPVRIHTVRTRGLEWRNQKLATKYFMFGGEESEEENENSSAASYRPLTKKSQTMTSAPTLSSIDC
jgi:hypothetical protein